VNYSVLCVLQLRGAHWKIIREEFTKRTM